MKCLESRLSTPTRYDVVLNLEIVNTEHLDGIITEITINDIDIEM